MGKKDLRGAALGSGLLPFVFGEGNPSLALELPRYLLVAVRQTVDLPGIDEPLKELRFLLRRKVTLIEDPKPLF